MAEREAKLSSSIRLIDRIELTTEETKLIIFLRGLSFGDVNVVVRNGVPVMLHQIKEDVKLTG